MSKNTIRTFSVHFRKFKFFKLFLALFLAFPFSTIASVPLNVGVVAKISHGITKIDTVGNVQIDSLALQNILNNYSITSIFAIVPDTVYSYNTSNLNPFEVPMYKDYTKDYYFKLSNINQINNFVSDIQQYEYCNYAGIILDEVFAFIQPNDPEHTNEGQWYHPSRDPDLDFNIGTEEAWDYTTGSSEILLMHYDGKIDIDNSPIEIPINRLKPYIDDDLGFEGLLQNHGWLTLGVAASVGNNNYGIAGVNWTSPIFFQNIIRWGPNAPRMGILHTQHLENLNNIRNDNSVTHGVMNCSWAIPAFGVNNGISNFDPVYGANIFIESWYEGHMITCAMGQDMDELQEILDAFEQYFGVTINENTIQPQVLGHSDHALAVGGYHENGYPYGWQGDHMGIVAPSVGLVTLEGNDEISEIANRTGTSFGSAITSGIASLVWSEKPELFNDDIVQILQHTTNIPYWVTRGERDYDIGYGYVSAENALEYVNLHNFTLCEVIGPPDEIELIESDVNVNYVDIPQLPGQFPAVDIYRAVKRVAKPIDLPESFDAWGTPNASVQINEYSTGLITYSSSVPGTYVINLGAGQNSGRSTYNLPWLKAEPDDLDQDYIKLTTYMLGIDDQNGDRFYIIRDPYHPITEDYLNVSRWPFTLVTDNNVSLTPTTTWTGTINLGNDYTIASGERLVIAPGTVITPYADDIKIIVQEGAELIAEGTSTERIVFDDYNGSGVSIRFASNASHDSKISYCDFYGSNNTESMAHAIIDLYFGYINTPIDNCNFYDCRLAIQSLNNNCDVTNCNFTLSSYHAGSYVMAMRVGLQNVVSVTSSTFSGYPIAINAGSGQLYDCELYVDDCQFNFSQIEDQYLVPYGGNQSFIAGINLRNCFVDIRNSYFTSLRGSSGSKIRQAIHSESSEGHIYHNRIEGFDVGVWLDGNSLHRITSNWFDNERYSVYSDNSRPVFRSPQIGGCNRFEITDLSYTMGIRTDDVPIIDYGNITL